MTQLSENKIIEKLEDIVDQFNSMAESENRLADTYGSMRNNKYEHKAKAEAFERCGAMVRTLINEINQS